RSGCLVPAKDPGGPAQGGGQEHQDRAVEFDAQLHGVSSVAADQLFGKSNHFYHAYPKLGSLSGQLMPYRAYRVSVVALTIIRPSSLWLNSGSNSCAAFLPSSPAWLQLGS